MSDEALRKWDTEVKGNSDDHLVNSPAPSLSRANIRSDRADRNIIVSDNTLSLFIDTNYPDLQDTDLELGNDRSQHSDQTGTVVDDDDQQNTSANFRHTVGGRVPPDHSFAATQMIHLTRGNTAYKIIESDGLIDDRGNYIDPITIVCLHGLTDSSYIWEDIADVLSCGDAGPCARVVVFDFYGRGR